MTRPVQPRTVRVAAVQAIAMICTEAVRQKTEPARAVVEVLDFLKEVAADRPTASTPELDEHLQALGFGVTADESLQEPAGANGKVVRHA